MVATVMIGAGGLAVGAAAGAIIARRIGGVRVTVHRPAEFMQAAFDGCCYALLWLGDKLGLSYAAVNVLVFCVLWPLLTVGLITAVIILL